MTTGTAGLGVDSISLNSNNQPGPTAAMDPGAIIALPEDVHVTVDITDGFYQLYPLDSLKGEFCGRYNEAVDNNWAKAKIIGPTEWGSPPDC